ncbi:ThuA domain-containing protein [Paenibacillus sp. 2TAB19]|uniref:ThuA domain-containing protein n=1 Tax=Paenibacillus sp. 2TAB19 TaxID=3233003 RepID=UPI003F9B2C3E
MMASKGNRRSTLIYVAISVVALAALFTYLFLTKDKSESDPDHYRVLVLSKTDGFRHDAIEEGIAAIRVLGEQNGFEVDATEDTSVFTDEGLDPYAAVVFLNTTGEILGFQQMEAFERYIQAGKGYVGVHSASDTLHSWQWYMDLVGGMFVDHPAVVSAELQTADRAHPSTASLAAKWTHTDEWYNFMANPRGAVHVLMTVDESTYEGGKMGYDHPVAWCQNYDGGRSWYTGLGHTKESYTSEPFLQHLLGGISWAAGAAEGDCAATVYSSANYQKQELMTGLSAPIGLDFAPDGRIFFIEIGGSVKVNDPKTGITTLSAKLPIVEGNEQGLLGMALDPEFGKNNWIYLFYSPTGAAEEDVLSRFEVKGDEVDLTTEKVMLRVPTQRKECCHHGGNLEFGPDGNLYLSTGDNTNPFESDGYAPTDERDGRSAWDARGTSGNTNDLRGKILRIKPESDGTYSIPEGNLFTDGSGKPEIYVMGVRNPYRMGFSPYDNALYWGDVGPDAGAPNVLRGPVGYDEINRATEAGNYGWPFCSGDNEAYRTYNFLMRVAGKAQDCAAIVNDSPNNTGAKQLPPAIGAMVYYPYGPSEKFPGITDGTGRTAAVAGVYKYDPDHTNPFRMPRYLDGSLIAFDFSREWFKEIKFDDQGNLMQVNPFLPNINFDHPIYAKIGPDGSLYVSEFASGSIDGKISRIVYSGAAGDQPPAVQAVASATNGLAPLAVSFSTEGTTDLEGGEMRYEWDFNGDGQNDSKEPNPSYTYESNGNYSAKVTVIDARDNAASLIIPITVGNRAPTIEFVSPAAQGLFAWGDTIEYEVRVPDADDGSIDCSKVMVTPALGHDEHAHPSPTQSGCKGSFVSVKSDTNIENTFLLLTATYTDNGTAEAAPLTSAVSIKLLSTDRQAEYYNEKSDAPKAELTQDEGGGSNIGFIENGSWLAFTDMNLINITGVKARVSSAGSGGTIGMRVGSPDGKLIAEMKVPVTGDWQKWEDVSADFTETPVGPNDIYFVFTGGEGFLFNINKFDFIGRGIASGE